MKRLAAASSVLALVVLASCAGITDPSLRRLMVLHHGVECVGEGIHLCIPVRAPGATEYLRHYGGIEGFTHEWGFLYEIEVEEIPVRNPPADGSSIRTVLRRELARERVPAGTEFEIFLTAGPFAVREVAPERYRVHDAVEFTCGGGSACAELRAHIESGARLRYRFRHPAEPGTPLLLVSWELCDRGPIGSNRCV